MKVVGMHGPVTAGPSQGVPLEGRRSQWYNELLLLSEA